MAPKGGAERRQKGRQERKHVENQKAMRTLAIGKSAERRGVMRMAGVRKNAGEIKGHKDCAHNAGNRE
jgi:hypothetical protein